LSALFERGGRLQRKQTCIEGKTIVFRVNIDLFFGELCIKKKKKNSHVNTLAFREPISLSTAKRPIEARANYV